jgi:hypothetical protein
MRYVSCCDHELRARISAIGWMESPTMSEFRVFTHGHQCHSTD